MKLEIVQPKDAPPERRVLLKVVSGKNTIAAGSGASLKEAATWLVRRINGVAEETEQLVLEAGLLTETEIEALDNLPPLKG